MEERRGAWGIYFLSSFDGCSPLLTSVSLYSISFGILFFISQGRKRTTISYLLSASKRSCVFYLVSSRKSGFKVETEETVGEECSRLSNKTPIPREQGFGDSSGLNSSPLLFA